MSGMSVVELPSLQSVGELSVIYPRNAAVFHKSIDNDAMKAIDTLLQENYKIRPTRNHRVTLATKELASRAVVTDYSGQGVAWELINSGSPVVRVSVEEARLARALIQRQYEIEESRRERLGGIQVVGVHYDDLYKQLVGHSLVTVEAKYLLFNTIWFYENPVDKTFSEPLQNLMANIIRPHPLSSGLH